MGRNKIDQIIDRHVYLKNTVSIHMSTRATRKY